MTRVAREVGTEGKLGGQASVEGVRGTWKELTDNVNQMASNLTNQVRDISAVATAIARGDMTRKISRRGPRRAARSQERHQHDGRHAERRSPTR